MKIVHEAVIFLVNYINNFLLINYSEICHQLKFGRVIEAEITNQNLSKYSIIFETHPNGAIFDSMIVHKNTTNNTEKNFELVGKISRVNLYGKTADCMKSNFLKNYCYCKNQLNS